jgi:rubrerythrin
MDTKKLLVEAVHKEQAAFELYDRLSKTIKNAEGAETFAGLARDEIGHRHLLEDWWRKKFAEPFPFDPKAVDKPKLAVDTQAGAVDALEIALEREKRAATLYEALHLSAADLDLKKLCHELAEQEWGHFATIRAEIAAVTGDFYWLDIDYAGHVED